MVIGTPIIPSTIYSFVYHHRGVGRTDQEIIRKLLARYNIEPTKHKTN